jgi:hypothetical protein
MKSSRSIQSSRENGSARVPSSGFCGMVRDRQRLLVPGLEVGEHEPDRVEHREAARRAAVEVLAQAVLEHRELDHRVLLGHAGALPEHAQRGRREAAPARARERGHARVVPAVDQAFLHELHELALAHHRVVEVAARELDLLRAADGIGDAALAQQRGQLGIVLQVEMVQEPVVERAVVLELERAERVRDAFDRVRDAVRVVVHRVDAPGVAGVLVRHLADAIDRRVAQVDVARRHVDLRAYRLRAVLELARAHGAEQLQVLRHVAIAERRVLAALDQAAAVFAHGVRAQVVDVGDAELDQLLGAAVEHLEVVRGVAQVLVLEAEPVHVVLDRLDVLQILLRGIGIVEAEVAGAAELARDPEVEADALGVPDVQITVRLGREARRDAATVLARRLVLAHDLGDEVGAGRRGFGHGAGSDRRNAKFTGRRRGAGARAWRGAALRYDRETRR